MAKYTQLQQSVILKGFSSNILQMNNPTFNEANKLLEDFDLMIKHEKETGNTWPDDDTESFDY